MHLFSGHFDRKAQCWRTTGNTAEVVSLAPVEDNTLECFRTTATPTERYQDGVGITERRYEESYAQL
ncbi:hypothetical protein E2C01_063677 [Portunus trituberculatus]|uniref:Uncharacterized protein n=1 Tax=Portunus trituberculatus TaxID=210409 RepID=A0A5B7HEB1_PORTR|nr:hypothetical protein [Portunus trituberculatus]